MQTSDFPVFRTLVYEVHLKAFAKPLSRLTHSKAQMLSWLIQEATGHQLSYKSLIKFVTAVLDDSPELVNPSLTTLIILAEYVIGDQAGNKPPLLRWMNYRSQLLAAA